MSRKYGLILLLFSLLVLFFGCARQREEEKAYREVLLSAGDIIAKMASACISHARSTINIKEYARLSGEDFDTVAEKIFGKEFQEMQVQLEANKAKIDEFMQGLEEPPPSLMELYEKLFELHALYSKIHTLAVSPSDSVEEYQDSINDLENQMNALKSGLDEHRKE